MSDQQATEPIAPLWQAGREPEMGRRAWAMVLLLVSAYALSFLDRQVLGLLVDGIRHDLELGDFQMGLLLGPAFGFVYALLGMPCGWLADRVRRASLIAGGLLLWTVATVASGLAHSFVSLAAARMAVGIGEATLVPAAVSMIADSFSPERRVLPLAIFTTGISIGAGLALLLGGTLVGLASSGNFLAVGIAPWRVVLITAGAAGVPLAIAIGLLREPVRRDGGPRGPEAGGPRLFGLLLRGGPVLVPLLLATSLLYIYSNALSAWMPSLFIRRFAWSAAQVGARMGYVVMASALAGTLVGGAWASRMATRSRGAPSLTVMSAGGFCLLPAGFIAPLIASPGGAEASFALVYFAMALCFGVATATLVDLTPKHLRGRMVAFYLLLGNLAGLGIGPPLVGFLLERMLADPARIDFAISAIAVPTLLPGAMLLLLARRRECLSHGLRQPSPVDF